MRNFVLGFLAGAACLYSSMCFHIVQADKGTYLIPKTALTFRDTFVDIRQFGVVEWKQHVPLAEAMIKSDKEELMNEAVGNSVRNAWDNLWDRR